MAASVSSSVLTGSTRLAHSSDSRRNRVSAAVVAREVEHSVLGAFAVIQTKVGGAATRGQGDADCACHAPTTPMITPIPTVQHGARRWAALGDVIVSALQFASFALARVRAP